MKSLLYSQPMVAALLAKVKTETRRTAGLEKVNENPGDWRINGVVMVKGIAVVEFRDKREYFELCKPRFQVGDIYYVKETWATKDIDMGSYNDKKVIYKADNPNEMDRNNWKSSMFMPEWASRLKRQITAVKCERVQDITEAGAIAEGVKSRAEYAILFDKINPGAWEKGVWVWVYHFKEVSHD